MLMAEITNFWKKQLHPIKKWAKGLLCRSCLIRRVQSQHRKEKIMGRGSA
jgi:hypothetical protein